jgi:hypothetical protein
LAPIAHSYADPATGCVHLTLRGLDEPFQDLVEVARSAARAESFKTDLYMYAWTAHRSLMVHEWAHVLQLATYPLLFLRSARAARLMIAGSVYLAGNPGRHPLPLRYGMDERWLLSNMLGTVGFTVELVENGLRLTPVPPGTVRRGVMTERDLIEEDATVFQYRAEIAGRGRGAPYRNWLRERPRYSRLFSFLAQQLGDDRALRTLPMLVRVAYRTTRPVQAFFEGLGTLMFVGEEDDDVLESVLLDALRESLGSIGAGVLTMAQPELDDPAGVIEDAAFEELVGSYGQLPIAPLARINLSGTDEQRGTAGAALRAPWEFFDRWKQEFDDRLIDYLPPAITVALDDPRFPAGSTLLTISPMLHRTPFPIEGSNYGEWTSATLKARLMWRAVMEGATEPNARCPHVSCRYHPTGLCNGWMTVPATQEDCEFPDFLRYTTKHELSADGLALEPAKPV